MKSSYQNLSVWKEAFQLVIQIYKITNSFPRSEMFGLTSQMRRSAESISSNIAEGKGRGSDGDFARFLRISKGSCNELENQLMIANELKYIDSKSAEKLMEEIEKILKMLSSLIVALKAKS